MIDGRGTFEMLRERTARIVAHNPQATNRILGTHQPIQATKISADQFLSSTIERLKLENAALKAEIKELQKRNDVLEAQIGANVTVAATVRKNYGARAVLEMFCANMRAASYEIDGEPYNIHHVLGRQRPRSYSDPRAVVTWICRRVCLTTSLPLLGRQLGGRDHSTIMSAVRRGPPSSSALGCRRHVRGAGHATMTSSRASLFLPVHARAHFPDGVRLLGPSGLFIHSRRSRPVSPHGPSRVGAAPTGAGRAAVRGALRILATRSELAGQARRDSANRLRSVRPHVQQHEATDGREVVKVSPE